MKKTNQKHPTRELAPQKKRIFFAFTVTLPFLLLICAELLLRWFDYGPDLSLFKQHEIRGQKYYLMNPEVKSRYFGTLNFAPTTSPEYFQVSKAVDTYRIFCLGGSTTVGYPYWYNGSFSSYLRDRLKATFPQRNVEIINLGMTATNSFTVLDMARELGAYQPDLIIVYDGHNEFYGALGVASQQTVGSSRFAAQLYLRMVHFRTFQFVRDGIQTILGLFSSPDRPLSRSTMMETLARDRYVSFGNSLYESAFSSFKENLEDLKAICREEGIPLLIGTQVSSLRDRPPFISTNSPALTSAQKASFRKLYEHGVTLRSERKIDSAIAVFRSALAIDSLYANTHYQIAKCFDTLGRRREALYEYVLARDYDELRFRTDSQFNDLIRSTEDRQSCFVADIETAFKALSPDSLVGSNLITEHLHPNSRGYFVIAQSYASVMREHGIFASREEWASAKTPDERGLWENRCVTELDERIAARRTEVLTSSWPFKDQVPIVDAIPFSDTLGQITEKTTEGQLDWKEAHKQAISFYERRGDWKNVEREYKTIINQIPLDLEPYMDIARLYYRQNRVDEMAGILLASLTVEPTIQAYRTLGDIALQKGNPAGALKHYERMDGFVQSPSEQLLNGYMICLAYAKAKELDKAKARLLELLKIKPDFQPAVELLVEVSKQPNDKPKE